MATEIVRRHQEPRAEGLGIGKITQPYKNINTLLKGRGVNLNRSEVINGRTYRLPQPGSAVTFQLAVCGNPELFALNYKDNPVSIDTNNQQIQEKLIAEVFRLADKPIGKVTLVKNKDNTLRRAPLIPQISVSGSMNLEQFNVVALIGGRAYIANCAGEYGMNNLHLWYESASAEEGVTLLPSQADLSRIFAMIVEGKPTDKDAHSLLSVARRVLRAQRFERKPANAIGHGSLI